MSFANHVTITDWNVPPFDNDAMYLLVSDGQQADCYQLSDDARFPIDSLVSAALGIQVTCSPESGGRTLPSRWRNPRPLGRGGCQYSQATVD